MQFGLKNAGATYQRAMNLIFHDLVDSFLECYIDDIVVKSHTVDDHINHLTKAFQRMKFYKLKLNPLKCAFGVVAGNFLGYMVQKKGSKLMQTKPRSSLRPNL